MTSLTETDFERLADEELQRLLDALIDSGEEVDPDLQMGVLSINFDDGGKYIVNSHRAARQIWMAAGTRAWHFDYDPQTQHWLTQQQHEELWATLSHALSEKLKTDVKLR